MMIARMQAGRGLGVPGLLTAALSLALVAGCRGEPTPTPVPPTPTQAAGPTLTVLREVVEYRERETDTLTALAVGDSMGVAPGANIVIGESGRATLDWPRFLRHELVARADTLLSLSEPNARHAILDQAAGTGRYLVFGAGEPTDLQVNAGFLGLGQSVAVIEVNAGPADLIVSIHEADDTVVWVAVLDGNAQVMRLGDELTLEAGTVATFTREGVLHEAFDVDARLIEVWYNQLADGQSTEDITRVAFYCRVTGADAPLLLAPLPSAGSAGAALASGARVKVLGRNEAATFVRVQSDLAEGWVDADSLTCVAAIPAAPLVIEAPTATPTLLATRPPLAGSPTLLPTAATVSPTPTGTATGEPFTFNFGVSPSTIDQGECANLTWEVFGVEAVYLDGAGVAGGSQSQRVCPDETTTYTMEVVKLDGTRESKSVTLRVQPAVPVASPEPSATTAPQPPPTETPEPEPTPTP